MQGKSSSSCFSLSEQRKFRFGLVCLLVQKFENLRFSQELFVKRRLPICKTKQLKSFSNIKKDNLICTVYSWINEVNFFFEISKRA